MKTGITRKPIIPLKSAPCRFKAVGIQLSLAIALAFFSFTHSTAQVVYATTTANKIISFNAGAPGTLLTDVPLSGIAANQTLEGLDFRPATGQLFALGYNPTSGQAQVYTVSPTNGVATAVGMPVTLAVGMSNIGFDFNPTVDRIRVTSAGGNSYRLNPNNGMLVATDGSLAFAPGDANTGNTPMVYTVGYTNSLATATSTTLYYYDYGTNTLGTVIPPNAGTLNTVGASGIAPVTGVGLRLDILSNATMGTNTAYLSANVTGTGTNFYTVNLATGAATLVGQIGAGIMVTEMSVTPAAAVQPRTIYGLSGGNLISFNAANPGVILASVPITGLAGGENIVGMDFRPATGQLYALGSGSRLYTINLSTGVATQVGASGAFTLSGTKFGFDFNPTVDRIRVTSDAGQNLRLNPNDGALAATDGTLAFAPGDANNGTTPNVGAVAYTKSFNGATTTTLYFYDVSLNITGTIIPPNNGTLNTVGASGVMVSPSAMIDMDIASDKTNNTDAAFLTASTNGTNSSLYRVNLVNGSTLAVGPIGANLLVENIAIYIAPPPVSRVVYAVAQGNLISFNSTMPGNILSTMPLTGVAVGQMIDGLDFRPATGELFALGYNAGTGASQLYTINTSTGAATMVGSGVMLPAGLNNISFDFNPSVDRIRVITNTGLNYRFNPNDGTIAATDTQLSYAAGDVHAGAQPNVNGVAYSNNLPAAATTQLYYYDINTDKLATTLPPVSPNAGQLNTIGASGFVTQNFLGLDIDIYTDPSTMMNTAFMSANTGGGASSYYQVNLMTGEAQLLGLIGSGILISDMAVALNITPVCVAPTLLNTLPIVGDASCNVNDGQIVLIPTSGTAPFMYSIDGGATYMAGPDGGYTFFNLAPGSYQLRIKDANGCQSEIITRSIVARYGVPTFLNTQPIVGNATCGQSDGQIVLIPTSGTGPFMYSIDGGTTYTPGPDGGTTFFNLPAGTYQLRIKSGSGCESEVIERTIAEINCPPATPTIAGASKGFTTEENLLTGKLKVSTYPNPSRGQFTLQVVQSFSSKAEVFIFDSKGTLVQQAIINPAKGSTLPVNLSGKAKGIYYVKVVSQQGTTTSKVLIQ